MGKVAPFHTDSDEYDERERRVFHDESECGYGKRVKADGNAIPGDDGRDRCERCETLAAEA